MGGKVREVEISVFTLELMVRFGSTPLAYIVNAVVSVMGRVALCICVCKSSAVS